MIVAEVVEGAPSANDAAIVAAQLKWRGLRAEPRKIKADGHPIAALLSSAAETCSADLLVMGSYIQVRCEKKFLAVAPARSSITRPYSFSYYERAISEGSPSASLCRNWDGNGTPWKGLLCFAGSLRDLIGKPGVRMLSAIRRALTVVDRIPSRSQSATVLIAVTSGGSALREAEERGERAIESVASAHFNGCSRCKNKSC